MSDREAVHYAIADGVATIARGKASVLAAMDLGYERGVLEAEHLRGATSAFPKNASRSGRADRL